MRDHSVVNLVLLFLVSQAMNHPLTGNLTIISVYVEDIYAFLATY